MYISSILRGCSVGLSLIVALGPQNTFVIKQGIRRQHVFISALVCSLVDALLIAIGVAGFGSIFVLHPLLTQLARSFGFVFLVIYGFMSFKAAINPNTLDKNNSSAIGGGLKTTILTLCKICICESF